MSLLCAYISLGQQYYKTCVGCEIICVREIISDSWNEFSEKKKKIEPGKVCHCFILLYSSSVLEKGIILGPIYSIVKSKLFINTVGA